jgi:ABC-type antimicrobial peptide transport system permease subunit
MENAGLLIAGLLCGSASALVAVAPQLGSVNAAVNWAAVIALIAAIMGVGLAACVVAAAVSVRSNLIEALRGE